MRRVNVLKLLCMAGAIAFGQAAAMCVPDNEIKKYSPAAFCTKFPDATSCKLVDFPEVGETWTLRSIDDLPDSYATYVTLEDGERLRIPDREGVRFKVESFSDDCKLARGTLEIPSSTWFSSSTYYENVTAKHSELR